MRSLSLLCLLALLISCDRRTYSEVLTEEGFVYDVAYVPAGHGSGIGVSTSGNATFTNVDIPARYAVVFQCKHGRFAVDCTSELYNRMTRGQAVTIHYREVFKDGKLIDLDFWNAYAKEGQE